MLIIPPHVEEYLIGVRKNLLGGLGTYPGLVFEIISAEEWDALQRTFKNSADISARFCLDGENIIWNVAVCMSCDVFGYTPIHSHKPIVYKSHST